MTWTWQFEKADGGVVSSRDLPKDTWTSQGDAESWLGEQWPTLLNAGVDQVTLMEDGRVAFLDFGMTKKLDREQIVLEQRAFDAASREDPEAFRQALHDLGFVKNPSKLDAERLMEHMRAVGGWYVEDREIEITPQRVMKIIESTNDPRSEYFDLMRRESIPAEELMGRRMEIGVVAVLGQLRAKRNWHRIFREWVYADAPATELGQQEWEYFEERGVKRTPGLAEIS